MNLTNLDDYITLYTKIFKFDSLEEPGGPGQGSQGQGPQGKGPEVSAPISIETNDYIYIDLSKLDIPSIYVNIFDQDEIHANGLNIGDGHSYVDFKKHKPTRVISFYRRDIDNTLLPMEYTDKKLYSIVNGKRIPIGAIIKELQGVLDQMSKI